MRVDRSRERLCCDGWILLSALGGGGFLVVGCRGLRFLLRALLLWGFAYCRSLPVASLCAQGLEPLLWEIAFGELLCGDVLWLYGVFVMHQFAPLCLFVADSRFAAYPGLPRFRGGCCGWCCGFWCCLLGDAASGISARLFSNCLTEPLIFPMRI